MIKPLIDMSQPIIEHFRNEPPLFRAIDWTAIGVGLGAGIGHLFGMLPTILSGMASLFSIVWLGIQIFVFIEKRVKGKK